jgi:hypothetical protein
VTTPDFMPILSWGSHRSPADGACFMEMASFLAGERWSDRPNCTHPLLASVARSVNDYITDAGRHRLLPLLPRYMGTTAGVGDERVGDALWAWKASHAPKGMLGVWDDGDDALLAFAIGLVDEYDRLTGRTPVPAGLGEAELRRCTELVSTS